MDAHLAYGDATFNIKYSIKMQFNEVKQGHAQIYVITCAGFNGLESESIFTKAYSRDEGSGIFLLVRCYLNVYVMCLFVI